MNTKEVATLDLTTHRNSYYTNEIVIPAEEKSYSYDCKDVTDEQYKHWYNTYLKVRKIIRTLEKISGSESICLAAIHITCLIEFCGVKPRDIFVHTHGGRDRNTGTSFGYKHMLQWSFDHTELNKNEWEQTSWDDNPYDNLVQTKLHGLKGGQEPLDGNCIRVYMEIKRVKPEAQNEKK